MKLKLLFHEHEWEVLSETTTESKVEQVKRLGLEITHGCFRDCEKKHITILTCKKCGKLKRFMEVI